MSKDKLNNLLKFTEYDHLQAKQSPTKKTEIGGFAVLEGASINDMIKLARKETGMSKKELAKLSPKKLKRLIGKKKFKKERKEEVEAPDKMEKDEADEVKEGILNEKKKASAKQLAARKKFMEMIKGKKGKGKDKDEECKDKK